ncbi:MAG: ribonuclease R [Patescibacteria group bacterium]
MKTKMMRGIIKLTAKPTGFVEVEGRDDDIIVFEEGLNCALNKDEVEVEIIGKSYDKQKGVVKKIIKRNKIRFVGTLKKTPSGFIFLPDDFKFYRYIDIVGIAASAKSYGEPKDGIKALVEINDWHNPALNPTGKIIEIIGERGLHETEMRSILVDKGIVYDFPPEVEVEAQKVSRGVLDTSGRKDFRSITTFTIDPKDAKDFDDALSFEIVNENIYRIGVHIADVSHFVRPGTALDAEARRRAFSVYLVDRTIPMLPEILSNDLCSLNPNVDRLTFSAVFDIEKASGKILSRWFGKTIINSKKRFTYEEAQEILNTTPSPTLPQRERESNPPLRGGQGEVFVQELFELDRIAKIYREENKKNGAIEFETDEVRFELDPTGKPLRVYKKERLDTMKMIEEWMLLANREVAKFISQKLGKKGRASIFRIHDTPNKERMEELAIFVRALGHDLRIQNGEVTAKDLNLMLSKLEGHASESLVRTAAVRAMAKAIYSTKNIGHFGLAFEYYTHFTSPIRRYPDLMIHRILEKNLTGEKIAQNEMAKFQKICDEASEKEVAASQAERESIRYKQVEFMQEKVGQEFDGVISGVTEWGIYVEEPSTKAEGMVRLKNMTDDSYSLDEKNYRVVGFRSKKKLSLGDKVRVCLLSADLARKTLDFKII